MRFRFRSKKLRDLYTDEKGSSKYPAEVVDAFFNATGIIDSAPDERDLWALASLRFEKLSGKRKGQHSLRLNKQWRLIVTFQTDEAGKYLVVEAIENHYKK